MHGPANAPAVPSSRPAIITIGKRKDRPAVVNFADFVFEVKGRRQVATIAATALTVPVTETRLQNDTFDATGAPA